VQHFKNNIMNILKFTGVICLFLLVGLSASAQSDSGISRHNYKHPNKNRIARDNSSEGLQVYTNNYRTAARLETLKYQSKVNSFPKYARKTALVTVTMPQVENSNNSLRNPANYKAQKQPSPQTTYTAGL
jgi:hypothetical protein